MVSDTLISEIMKNYYWSLITSIKGNYYFVFYYFYSLRLQTPKLDVEFTLIFFLYFFLLCSIILVYSPSIYQTISAKRLNT